MRACAVISTGALSRATAITSAASSPFAVSLTASTTEV
jgi:hypothetical protein